jgi:hypothetical protein
VHRLNVLLVNRGHNLSLGVRLIFQKGLLPDKVLVLLVYIVALPHILRSFYLLLLITNEIGIQNRLLHQSVAEHLLLKMHLELIVEIV